MRIYEFTPDQIKTKSDVRWWLACAIIEERLLLTFHPDNTFQSYTFKDGQQCYSETEARTCNTIIERCYEILNSASHENNGNDNIYNVCMEILLACGLLERETTVVEQQPDNVNSREWTADEILKREG